MIPHQDRNLTLLGPQPHYESLRSILAEIPHTAPVGLITAGWETEEDQDLEIRNAVGIEVINLNLFARTEKLFQDDPELIQQLQHRQDELRLVRDVYNERLRQQAKAARWVFHHNLPEIDLTDQKESSIAMMRQLDQEHFDHASRIIDFYEQRLQTSDRPLVKQHRRELASVLERCSVLLIAGGHVAIILNRLQIFGILELTPQIPVIAWSAGAMALSERIVVYHDSLPQSLHDAEVLRPGLNAFTNVLPLPDAQTRLSLDDPLRVELFARRFEGFQSVVFDSRTILQRHRHQWHDHTDGKAKCLNRSGNLVEFQA